MNRLRHLISASAGIGAMATALATPAAAQQAPGAAETSGDIIVTARRVEERLQDVPISISVVSQAQIASRNITTSGDIATYVPSLSFDRRFNSDNAVFAIRGFFQDQSSTPTVGVYFADVVAPRGGSVGQTPSGDGVGPGALFDLANVQVLKGPQGTLFGRNTTGGTVLFVPNKPTQKLEGYVEGSAGNYDMRRVQGVINLPVSDTIRFRFGVDRMKRQGYQDNIADVGPKHFADVNYLALRASMVIDVTPDLENYTIASYSRSNTNGQANKIVACNSTLGLGPLFGLLGVCDDQLARQNEHGFYTVANGYTQKAQSYVRQWQVINTTTWTVSDNFTIKNIASYGEFVNRYGANPFGDDYILNASAPAFQDGSPLAPLRPLLQALNGQKLMLSQSLPAKGYNNADQRTMTEELQFQGHAFENKLTWQAGLYMERSDPIRRSVGAPAAFIVCPDQANFQCTDLFGILSQGALTGSLSMNSTQVYFRDYGIYTQATYELSDKLKVTGGLRYTVDKMRSTAHLVNYAFPAPNTPSAYCFLSSSEGPASDPINGCRSTASKKTDAPTGTIDVEYSPSRDVMIYAKYSRGFRQGGVSPRTVVRSYDAEKIDAYEAGTKFSFHGTDVSGTFNLAAFYNKLFNQQLQASFLVSGATLQQGLLNIGASRVYGLEMDSSLRLFNDFHLDLAGAYLNTKITDTGTAADIANQLPPDIQGRTTVLTNYVKGQPLPLAPKYRLTATAAYDLPIPESLGKLTVAATFTYSSKAYGTNADDYDPANAPKNYLSATRFVNANLDWRGIGGSPVDASLFVTNLFKKKYEVAYLGGWNSLGSESAALGEPRMIGLRLRYSFGE